jgi:fucose permease
LTSALVVPFGWGFAFAPNATSASLLLAPASFLAGSYFGPMYSAVQTLAAPQTRALAGASVTIVNTLLGLGIAPPLVGWLNDVGTASYGIEAIRYSLGAIFVAHLGAAALFLRAAPTLRRDLDAKRRFLASNP